MHRVVMLCPVGTSFISNISMDNKDDKERLLQLLDETRGWRSDPSQETSLKAIREAQDGLFKNIKEAETKEFWQELRKKSEEISSKFPASPKKFPSAELQSVIRWLNERNNQKICLEVKLAPSQEEGEGGSGKRNSIITAYVTRIWLKELWKQGYLPSCQELEVDIEPVVLNVNNRSAFYEGVDKLFKWYDAYCHGEPDPEEEIGEIVINATGGYKSVSAFSVLYAQIHDLPCIYTFESDPSDIVELLPLPLSYALDALDEEMALLRGIVEDPDSFSGISSKELPRWLQGLCRPDEDGIHPLALAKTLVTYYKENRHRTGGIGRGLLDQLKRPTQKYFEKRITNEWSELWMGDQIPETVEHSRRHSKRLMELGGNLFRAAEPELYSLKLDHDGALALLIACIYLHDIGHTAVAFPVDSAGEAPSFPLAMFPSCVREVHHLLSRDLITLRKETLFPDPEGSETLVPMLRTLVPLVCSYHRRYTTLCCGLSNPSGAVRPVGELLYGFGDFKKTLVPLTSRLGMLKKELKDWGLSPEMVLRVAALLRVLDGCDVQADRAVGAIYMRARLERTWDEGHALWRQIQPLLSHLPAGTWETLAGMYELVASREGTVAMAVAGNLDGQMRDSLDKKAKSVYELVFQDLLALRQKPGFSWDRLWEDPARLVACSLANRLAFKWEQFLHFYKHRCVGFVLPVRREERGTICLWPNRDMRGMETMLMETMLADVQKDIEKEIEKTQGLLEGLRLGVEVISSKEAIVPGAGTSAAEESGSH